MKCRWAAVAMLAWSLGAQAHIASNGFLVAQVSDHEITGSLELAVRDVELAIGVDSNGDGKVTWGELRAREPDLRQYVARHLLLLAQSQACTLTFKGLEVNERVDGEYAWLPFTAQCPATVRQLGIRYDLMEQVDPSHRGMLTLQSGTTVQTAVLGGNAVQAAFNVNGTSRWRTFEEYLQAGIWHIWSGIDHLLFLLSLLLPAVLLRTQDHWEPVPRAQPALLDILKVVTSFTLAHSMTLMLAALNVVRLPSRLTESVIAASIIVAAVNNIFPVVTEKRTRIAFAFGLLHGFGFASVLADMGLPPGARLISLLAFNLGIETGQLAVVITVMPLIYFLRTSRFYRRALLPWGSAAIACVAFIWLVQRSMLLGG
jgi:hypothetical protein